MASSKFSAFKIVFGVAALGVGGLLFYYGRSRKGTLTGRMTTTVGISLLVRALRNPVVAESLGPFRGLLEGPLAAAQKLLA